MTVLAALDPVGPGATGMMEHRYRPMTGERSVLPEGPKRNADANRAQPDQRQFARQQGKSEDAVPAPPARTGAADFAAAVIAGALPPRPQSMNELIRRIGASEIPEESMARLKDLLA